MQDNSQQFVKLGLGAIALIMLIAILLAIWNAVSIAGKEKVEIYIAPLDSVVTINGKRIKDTSTYLKEGSYSYSVTRDHFTPMSGTLVVKKGASSSIIAPLDPLDNEGRTLYKQRRNDYLRLEDFANTAATIKGENFQEKNPIVGLLPYSNMLFTIGYKNDPSDNSGESIILTIHTTPDYYDAAVTQISNWGYDPVDYKIEINKEENPFK